jgi:hypothetical protein
VKDSTDQTRSEMNTVDLYTADGIVKLVRILVSHTYIHNGSIIKRQVKGLSMGTDPVPHMADLTCYRAEAQAIDRIMQTDVALAHRVPLHVALFKTF